MPTIPFGHGIHYCTRSTFFEIGVYSYVAITVNTHTHTTNKEHPYNTAVGLNIKLIIKIDSLAVLRF